MKGQYDTDQSWVYSPMLAIENAEIGGTLIALCVPGLKPLFLHYFSVIRESIGKSGGGVTDPNSVGMKNVRRSGQHSSKKTYERAASENSSSHNDPYGESLIVTECKADKQDL